MENWFQKICRILTKHRFRKGTAWTVGKYRTREFYYKCRICGKTFWNYTPSKEYLKAVENGEEVDNGKID